MSSWKTHFINALPAMLLSRSMLFAIVIFAHSTSLTTIPAREEHNFHPELHLSFEQAKESLRCVFSSADASWYFRIAESGYDSGPFTAQEPKNWTFFPLLPLSIFALNQLTGHSLISGLLLSNFSFLLAVVVIQRIAEKKGLEERAQKHLPWLICFFPTSYFFSSPLTESLFLLLTSSVWLFVLSGNILLAGFLMALASATRPTGLLVLPAFLCLMWEQRVLFSLKGILATILAPLGALFYMAYLFQLTGEPLAFAKNQFAWNRGGVSFFTFLANTSQDFFHVLAPWNPIWLNLLAACLGIVAVAAFALRGEKGFALFLLVPIATALLTGTALSTARFLGGLFPIYLYLLSVLKTERAERIALAVCVSLFAIFSLLYGLHITAAMASIRVMHVFT